MVMFQYSHILDFLLCKFFSDCNKNEVTIWMKSLMRKRLKAPDKQPSRKVRECMVVAWVNTIIFQLRIRPCYGVTLSGSISQSLAFMVLIHSNAFNISARFHHQTRGTKMPQHISTRTTAEEKCSCGATTLYHATCHISSPINRCRR